MNDTAIERIRARVSAYKKFRLIAVDRPDLIELLKLVDIGDMTKLAELSDYRAALEKTDSSHAREVLEKWNPKRLAPEENREKIGT